MRKVTRKRFIAVICYFVAITLSLAPVAHASSVVLDGSVNQSVENGHNCDQQAIDLKNSSTHEHMKGAVTTDCEHGTTCKLLCSASVSVSHEKNIFMLSTINSNRWLPIDISALKSSFLSRLERPPKP